MAISSNSTASIIKDAALALKQGNLVAFPTETVYGLGADATNEKAIAKVYEVKGRPTDHPLIVHISSMDLLAKWASEIPEYAITLARAFWPGPMTLILPRTDLARDFITGAQNNVGVRVPSHPLALALLEEFESIGGLGVAAPSANRFGKVSPTSAEAVQEELSDYLTSRDLILDGGSSLVGIESTIIDCTKGNPIILRPGSITKKNMSEILNFNIERNLTGGNNQIKAPGLLKSHYAPRAKIFLTGLPSTGDGFIALSNIPTPTGAIRLISPINHEEYARKLYYGLRLADSKNLAKVFVIPPIGDDISVAICDRLKKASMNRTNFS